MQPGTQLGMLEIRLLSQTRHQLASCSVSSTPTPWWHLSAVSVWSLSVRSSLEEEEKAEKDKLLNLEVQKRLR